jgi:tetratricopeptide (TPR) repeat protein
LLGIDHPNTLGTANNLSYLLYKRGNFSDAEEFAMRVAEGYRLSHGETHQNTMNAFLHAGDVLVKMENYKRAETYYREGLRICVKLLGEEHPKTLETTSLLAMTLDSQGKIRDALWMREKALDGYMNANGERHITTGEEALLIALLHEKRKSWEKAADMYDLAYCSFEHALGSHNEKTLLAKKGLIAMSLQAEKYAHLNRCTVM